MKFILLFFTLVTVSFYPGITYSQVKADSLNPFTHADSLRGMLTPARSCYDVTFYDLVMGIDIKRHSIKGNNTIYFDVLADFDSMQIDLFHKIKIDSIVFNHENLKYRRDQNAVFIKFPSIQKVLEKKLLTIYYSGVPQVAKSPPWDGGFVWKKDAKNQDWIGVACEGTGSSLWWPCKDHLSDEPDSMQITFTVPTGLSCISNGNLRDTTPEANGTTKWQWFVSYPINNYNVTVNIAGYSHFSDYYLSGSDTLQLDYYVLPDNVNAAKEHFQQVKLMMACYEKYFGRYPFWRDGYALVETNYWGMEHQGAISYGNNYTNNKQGFDYIIVHESAHEWWGNNVSVKDAADMWIHESFATYAEALFIECNAGYNASIDYLKTQRWKIVDKQPNIGPYNVNYDAKDKDLYNKGAWMLHTFRSVVNNDSLFFNILYEIQQHFKLQTITSDQLIAFINEVSGKDNTAFFDQYLHYAAPPVLEYKTRQKGKKLRLTYRWKTDVGSFNMPVEVTSASSFYLGKMVRQYMLIHSTSDWQTITFPKLKAEDFDVNSDRYYVKKEKVK
ncbi:MAG: M1 family metallopeptidase [Chitinophagales bacterium]|nr:M1 family metallopeptidase [Chitinophagales bacterium]